MEAVGTFLLVQHNRELLPGHALQRNVDNLSASFCDSHKSFITRIRPLGYPVDC